jgi:UPF0716 protein FxsA
MRRVPAGFSSYDAGMLIQLLLLFTLVPLLELAVMIKAGEHVGVMPTIAMVLAAGFVGAGLAKHEGLRTFRNIQADLAAGRLPGDRMIDALLILAAGVLLIAPGFLTDCVAILLLVPPIRAIVRRYLKKRFAARFTVIDMNRSAARPQDDLIDVEARSPEER